MRAPSKSSYKRSLSINKWKATNQKLNKTSHPYHYSSLKNFNTKLMCYDSREKNVTFIKATELFKRSRYLVGQKSFNYNVEQLLSLNLIQSPINCESEHKKKLFGIISNILRNGTYTPAVKTMSAKAINSYKVDATVQAEYNRKANIYLLRLGKLDMIEQDVSSYLLIRRCTQFNQDHLTTMFKLLRKYNAIGLDEIV